MSQSSTHCLDLDCLQQNTLIIPTFNRPQYLVKLINYYAEKKTSMNFLVLDSSHREIADSNHQVCSALGNKIRHIVFEESVPVLQKLTDGLKLVETPYCTFGADDDLTFVDGIAQSLTYLQNHPDYVCVDGIYLNFKRIENDVKIYIEYSGRGIEGNHPIARIFRLFQNYESLFYGVCKTSQMVDVFASANKLSTLSYQEIFQSSATLLLGKKQRLPIFYAARNSCGRADSRDKWNSHSWFIENPQEHIHSYLPYREELWKFYEQHAQQDCEMSKDTFNRSLDLAYTTFLMSGGSPQAFYSALQNQWPDDLYTDPREDDLYQQLKKPIHRKWDARIGKGLNFLQKHHKKLFALLSLRGVRKLNREIERSTHVKWNCIMRKDLQWLSSLKIFREAYKELCLYLKDH